MDGAWRKVFNEKASKEIPDYQASCWTKDGFDERLSLFPLLVEELQLILKKSSFSPLKSVLDVGCGPGVYCRLFADKNFVVTGVDYAENTLLRAKNSSQKNIRYLKADAYDLPFNNSSFDLVISIGVLQCVEFYERFVKELCRTAKIAVIISTLRTTSKTSPDIRLQNQLRYDSWPTRTYHPETFVDIFERAGFNTFVKFKNVKGDILSDSFFIVAIKKEFLATNSRFDLHKH